MNKQKYRYSQIYPIEIESNKKRRLSSSFGNSSKSFFSRNKKKIFIVIIILLAVLLVALLLYFLKKHVIPDPGPPPKPYPPSCYVGLDESKDFPQIPFNQINPNIMNNEVLKCNEIPDKFPLIPICNPIPPNLKLTLPSSFQQSNNTYNVKILNSTYVPVDVFFSKLQSQTPSLDYQVYNINNQVKSITEYTYPNSLSISLCPGDYILITNITNYASEKIWVIPSGSVMHNPFGVSYFEWTIENNSINYDISGVDGANFHGKAGFFVNNNSLQSDSLKWFYPRFETYQNSNNYKYQIAYNSQNEGQGFIDLDQGSVTKTPTKNFLGVITGLSEKYKKCGANSCQALKDGQKIINLLNSSDAKYNFDFSDIPQNTIDCCLSSCPLPSQDKGGINQHYCRKWYHENSKKPTSYCKWLQQKNNDKTYSSAYCWALDEWKCTDDNCGWSDTQQVDKCMGAFTNMKDKVNRCSCLYSGLCKSCKCFDQSILTECGEQPPDCKSNPQTSYGTTCANPQIENAITTKYGCVDNNNVVPDYQIDGQYGTLVCEISYVLPSLYIKKN